MSSANPIAPTGGQPGREGLTLSPRRWLEGLLEAEDPAALVQAQSAEELYFAISELGLADATEVVQLASPEQFRAFVDLGGWTKDRLEVHSVLRWLRAARGDESEAFLAKVRAMDLEVLEWTLRQVTAIYDLEENPDVNPEGSTMETPDGKYLIEVQAEGVEQSAVRQLLQDLIAQDPFEAVRLLEAIRWEMPSELEETAYRFRLARLADLGFPELEAALSLYAYVAPEKRAAAPADAGAAGDALQSPARQDYLEAGFAGLTADERDGLAIELRYLVNAAMVADAADPGDGDAVRRLAEVCRDLLSLGIEQLCGADASRAADALRGRPLKQVFQVGFSLTLDLKFRADRLVSSGELIRQGDSYLLLPEEAAAVSALRRKRPLRALKVEGAEPVPFRSRRELREAGTALDRAQRQAQVFRALLGGDARVLGAALAPFDSSLTALGVERLWSAWLAGAALDETVRAAPIEPERVSALLAALFAPGPPASIRPEARERVRRALLGRVPAEAVGELDRMIDLGLRRFLEELGPAFVRGGEIDFRVVAEVVPIRLGAPP